MWVAEKYFSSKTVKLTRTFFDTFFDKISKKFYKTKQTHVWRENKKNDKWEKIFLKFSSILYGRK
jgi:hypothetical protein